MITTCDKCGGLRAEPGESYGGRGCECPLPPARGSEATCGNFGKPMRYNVPRLGPDGGYVHAETGSLLCAPVFGITEQDFKDIEDLANRVTFSRQNVGTPMLKAAGKVHSLISRLKCQQPQNKDYPTGNP